MVVGGFQQKLWSEITKEAEFQVKLEPVLASFYHASILRHNTFCEAISYHIATKLGSNAVPAILLQQVFEESFLDNEEIVESVCKDLHACRERDAACDNYSVPFLYYKGFHSLQAYRVAHWLWLQGRCSLALFLQNRISAVFDVDIHPAAQIGYGIMIDHATGTVIGETTKIGNNVSLLHSVTLGGCGSVTKDRHPRIGDGVLIGAGAKVLGSINIGEGVKIAACSLVLDDVDAHVTVAGVPAKVVGRPSVEQPALDMNQQINDE